jgi:hypothetical protein
MENVINLLKKEKNVIGLNILESFKLKDGKNFSSFRLKIATNKRYNKYVSEKFFSFSGAQNFFRNVNNSSFEDLKDENGKTFKQFSTFKDENGKTYQKTFEQLTAENLLCDLYLTRVNAWLFLRELRLSSDEITYSLINDYAGKHLKKRIENSPENEKVRVSFNEFMNCLQSYKAMGQKTKDEKIANEANLPETIETVIISEQPETIETVLTSVQKGMITKLTNKLKNGKIDEATFNTKLAEIKKAA